MAAKKTTQNNRRKKKNGMGGSLADRTTNPASRGGSLADRTINNVIGPSLADRTTNPLSRPATVTGGPGVIGRSSRATGRRAVGSTTEQAGFTEGGTFTLLGMDEPAESVRKKTSRKTKPKKK